MAITTKEEGVWGIDKVFAKQNQGSIWDYDTAVRELWAWGHNDPGNLGQNDRTHRSSAVQVPGTTWKMIYSDGGAIGATKNDGTFWVWGINPNNQGLGIQSTGDRSSPVQLPGTNWPTEPGKATFAGQHSAAIKTDGSLWVWGMNSHGRLGHNQANTSYNSPKQVGSDKTWNTVSINYEGTYATKTDGTAWSWGWNDNGNHSGILGQGNQTNYSSPRQIGSATNWSHIQTSGDVVLATKTDGTLWSWGINESGQLGQNNSPSNLFRDEPMQIGSDSDWDTGADKMRTSSRYNVGAIKTDGTLWTWGSNSYGQLGQNNRITRSSPRQVPGTWTQFSTRHDCCFALNSDNEVWVWGRNHQGQLAQNHNNHRSSPVQVHGLNSSGTFSRVQAFKDGASVIEDK